MADRETSKREAEKRNRERTAMQVYMKWVRATLIGLVIGSENRENV